MSYDLTLFFPDDVSARLREIVAREPDLAVETNGDGILVRRGRGRYCCSIGPAIPLELEDLPDEILSRSAVLTHLVEINVEGSDPTSIARTRKLARALVRALDGVGIDPQTGSVDPARFGRRPSRTEAGLTDLVELEWYTSDVDSPAEAYLASAERYLPEAMPRRFGSYEPLQFRLDRDGADRFVAETASDDSLFWKGESPVLGGSSFRRPLGPTTVSINILASSLREPGWRVAVRAFFVDVARRLDCFFASAELVRGYQWTGRTIWVGPEAEQTHVLNWREGWMGLPPYPVWCAYFGREYAPLVGVPDARYRVVGDGVVAELSDEPLDRDALAARAAPWVAPELRVTPLQITMPSHVARVSPPAAERAEVIPGALGVPIAPPGFAITHSWV